MRAAHFAILVGALAACGRLDFDSVANDTTSRDGGIGTSVTGDGGGGGGSTGDGGTADVTLTGIYLLSGDGVGETSVLTLDLATGDVSTVGTSAASAGQLEALAYWDANTLYAAGGGQLIAITLEPFGAVIAAAIPTDKMVAMENEAPSLTLVDASASELVLIDPTDGSTSATKPFGVPIMGGGFARTSFGLGAYYFSNSNHELYNVYTATGNATDQVNEPTLLGVEGMFSQSSYAQYYVTSSALDAVIPIDVTSGTLGTAIPLCHPCPGTAYDLLAGDATAVTP